MAKYIRDLLEKKFNSNSVGFLQLGAFQNKDGKQGIILVNPDVITRVFDEVEADVDEYVSNSVLDTKREVIANFDKWEEELLAKHDCEKKELNARLSKAMGELQEMKLLDDKRQREIADLQHELAVYKKDEDEIMSGLSNFLNSPAKNSEESLITHMRGEIRFLRHLVETGWKKK